MKDLYVFEAELVRVSHAITSFLLPINNIFESDE